MQRNDPKGTLVLLNNDNADNYFDFWLATYQHPKVNGFFFKPHDMAAELMRDIYNSFIKNTNVRFFIYVDENKKPIGTCRITFFEGIRSHVAMINAVAINPDIHSRGYGTAMLNEVKNLIQTEYPDIKQIELAYEGDNKAGRRLYEEKLGFHPKISYEDWWFRYDLKEAYPWYTEERCCVNYLNQTPDTNKPKSTYDQPNLATPSLLPESFSIAEIQPSHFEQEIKAIADTYKKSEASLMQHILLQPNQTVYALKKDSTIVALLCFKPYENEPRLTNAVTMPFVAYKNGEEEKNISSFINQAMQLYKQSHSEVFHFACAEEDTTENWYADKHSKIESLNRSLQNAGFRFAGEFENYFNDQSESGKNLLAYECCFLGLKAASQCLDVSKLASEEKNSLKDLLNQFSTITLAHREEYEIYRMVRYVAYPQDYNTKEIAEKLLQSHRLLQSGPHFVQIQSLLSQLRNTLWTITNGTYASKADQIVASLFNNESKNSLKPTMIFNAEKHSRTETLPAQIFK